jgi:hypothetical protein
MSILVRNKSVDCELNFLKVPVTGRKVYLHIPIEQMRILSFQQEQDYRDSRLKPKDKARAMKNMKTCGKICGYKCFEGSGIMNKDKYAADGRRSFINQGYVGF